MHAKTFTHAASLLLEGMHPGEIDCGAHKTQNKETKDPQKHKQ